MASHDRKAEVSLFLVPNSAPSPRSDEVLVGAFRLGEPDAAQQIWEKYALLVDKAMRRFLGPDADTEDLVQEVFLRCFSRLHTLEDPGALRSFIYSIAVRVFRWEVRRRRMRRWVQFLPGQSLPELAAASHDFEARQAVARFFRILDRLGPGDRAIFVIRHFEGLTNEEGARSVGTSVATFKRRLVRVSNRVAYFVGRDAALTEFLQTTSWRGGEE